MARNANETKDEYNARMREYLRGYRQTHKEKVNADQRRRQAAYRETHRAEHKAYMREYREKHHAELVEKDRLRQRARREAKRAVKLGEKPTVCRDCGKPIEQPRTGRRVRCEACAREAMLAKSRAWNKAHARKPIGPVEATATCEICGAVFTYTFKFGRKRRFCSAACLAAHKEHRLEAAREERMVAREARKAARAARKTAQTPRNSAQTPRKAAKGARGPALTIRKPPTGALTVAQARQVAADMRLDAAARYEASKLWSPAMRAYAQKLWREQNEGNWQ